MAMGEEYAALVQLNGKRLSNLLTATFVLRSLPEKSLRKRAREIVANKINGLATFNKTQNPCSD